MPGGCWLWLPVYTISSNCVLCSGVRHLDLVYGYRIGRAIIMGIRRQCLNKLEGSQATNLLASLPVSLHTAAHPRQSPAFLSECCTWNMERHHRHSPSLPSHHSMQYLRYSESLRLGDTQRLWYSTYRAWSTSRVSVQHKRAATDAELLEHELSRLPAL